MDKDFYRYYEVLYKKCSEVGAQYLAGVPIDFFLLASVLTNSNCADSSALIAYILKDCRYVEGDLEHYKKMPRNPKIKNPFPGFHAWVEIIGKQEVEVLDAVEVAAMKKSEFYRDYGVKVLFVKDGREITQSELIALPTSEISQDFYDKVRSALLLKSIENIMKFDRYVFGEILRTGFYEYQQSEEYKDLQKCLDEFLGDNKLGSSNFDEEKFHKQYHELFSNSQKYPGKLFADQNYICGYIGNQISILTYAKIISPEWKISDKELQKEIDNYRAKHPQASSEIRQ